MTANPLTTRSNIVSARPGQRVARKKREQTRLRIAYLLFALMFFCLGVGAVAFILINPAVTQFGRPFLVKLPQEGGASGVNSAPLALPLTTETQVATVTVTPTFFLTATSTASPSPSATATLTATFTLTPTETPTEQDTPTPLPTDTPEPTLPAPALPNPAAQSGSGGGVKWIEVDLSDQMLYAWEGKTLAAAFVVSTGAAPYHTVTGSYAIYERHRTANMWGPGYFYPDVPYTMYFYKGYGIHGTYWHNNFGTPMSRGCVNMSIPDAEWLYYWASMGTSVKVHP